MSVALPFDHGRWRPVRRGRLALVFYIDLMMAMVPAGALGGLARPWVPWIEYVVLLVTVLLVTVAELLLLRFRVLSPGGWLLGIKARVRGEGSSRALLVDSKVVERESWLSLTLGAMLLPVGAFGLLRWTHPIASIPLFGLETNEVVTTMALMGFSALTCYVACCLFAQTWRAVPLGLVLCLVTGTAVALSFDLWDGWLETQASVDPELWLFPNLVDVAMAQWLLPEGICGFLGLLFLAFLSLWRSLRQR